jgi:hypothetical protein
MLHGVLPGRWIGTLTSPNGTTSAMTLLIAHDSLQRLTLTRMAGDRTQPGRVRDVVVEAGEIHWTEKLAGKFCKAAAALQKTAGEVSPALTGSLSCEGGAQSFALQKTAG